MRRDNEAGNTAWRGSGGRLVVRILRRYRVKVAGIFLATVGVYAAGLAVPVVTQKVIDGIMAGRPAYVVGLLGLLAIVFALLDVVLADLHRALVIDVGQRVDRHISLEIMRRVLGSRIDAMRNSTGEVLNRTEQAEKIKTFLIDLMPRSVFDIGGALIAAIVVFAYSAPCGACIAAIAVGGFLVSNRIFQTLAASISRQFRLTNEKQGYLAETVGGLSTIKTLAIESARFRVWSARVKDLIRTDSATQHVIRRFSRATRTSQHLLTLAVVGTGGFQLLRGSLSIGELFAILMLTDKISAPLLGAADVARQCQEVGTAVRELGHLLDAPPDRATEAIPAWGPRLSGEVSFRDVTYRYHGSPAPAVAGLSIQMPGAGLVAIVGRNGSGKTTVLRLLQGFLREFDGEILVGGSDVRSCHPPWLRSQLAVVDQDTVLFAGTIRDNITCWTQGVADADIEAALRLAGAWEFVGRLPGKVDARLTENGSNLSGGQRQRLAVARAVMRDPRIILLDEPTAFLDAEAAVALEERLCAWGEGRLMILVTHHLAAARLAGTILLMDAGAIVARGQHDALLEASPLYRSLWNDYLRGAAAPASTVPSQA